jgi:hypothetical protein
LDACQFDRLAFGEELIISRPYEATPNSWGLPSDAAIEAERQNYFRENTPNVPLGFAEPIRILLGV